ncbi:MAG: ABC transporter permease, partial [Agathobacter sp.]|nr:ABC transporter permease [Agathobacter sp.]
AALYQARLELAKGQEEYEKGVKELEDARKEIDDGWEEVEQGYEDLLEGKKKLEAGKAQFDDGKVEYEDSVSKYEEKKAEAIEKIADARKEIEDLKMTEWYVSTRTALSGYSNIKTDAQCIESIGNAFPILFMVVAILISLTTVSRMVEEDRGLIGTYKALGFTDREIRRKYVVYALLAGICGGILGDFLGFVVLPEIIFTVFGVMYQLPAYGLYFNWWYGIGGILFFIVGIVGAAFVSCNSALTITPAMLMRPKAPKNGSRVLLERVTPVWSNLSFLNKVTARNLFRYKKRLFMTLFGIAGCTSILLAGFTIKDTVTELMPLQYRVTTLYDVMVVADDNEQLLEYLDSQDVRAYINPMINNVKVISEDGREESVSIVVVPNDESLRGYVNIVDKDGNKVILEDGKVFSTINVSEVLGYKAGDTVTIQNMNLDNAEVEITDIVMNYLGNYIYMTENTYVEYYDEFEANGAFVMLNSNVKDHEEYAQQLALKDGILSAISIEGFESNFDSVFMIINLVVTIVITLAAALAFVVLFTLSTTNISERERELATIKVLGFFDREVHAYVNKETIILTTLGMLLGMPLGKGFGIWLMSILKMPAIYFADNLYPISYLYAAVITIIFAFAVNTITDKSLDKINPVEALKSIE